jgi:hypothetical protein
MIALEHEPQILNAYNAVRDRSAQGKTIVDMPGAARTARRFSTLSKGLGSMAAQPRASPPFGASRPYSAPDPIDGVRCYPHHVLGGQFD